MFFPWWTTTRRSRNFDVTVACRILGRKASGIRNTEMEGTANMLFRKRILSVFFLALPTYRSGILLVLETARLSCPGGPAGPS